jgi:FkbM family methyltransferase
MVGLYARIYDLVHSGLAALGYTLIRSYRFPKSTLDLLGLAVSNEFQKNKDFFFVQIGANDGMHNDPLREHVLKYRLPGLLVEPLPEVFQQLRDNYKGHRQLQFENCAVSGRDGSVVMHCPRPDPGYKALSHQKASVIRNNLVKNPWINEIVEIQVPALTFASLMKKHRVKRISLLQLDAEGLDLLILRQAFKAGFRPCLVHFEISHLTASDKKQGRDLLTRYGYRYAETTTDSLSVLIPEAKKH